MTRAVHARFPLSAAGLALALVISSALSHAQSDVRDLALVSTQYNTMQNREELLARYQASLNQKAAQGPASRKGKK